jgi:inner membrane protein
VYEDFLQGTGFLGRYSDGVSLFSPVWVIIHTMQPLLHSPGVKFFLVGVLTLILMIPMAFVSSLVNERESRYRDVEQQIAVEWGARQYIAGPILLIPVKETLRTKDGSEEVERLHAVLPDNYVVDVTLDPTTKQRGLFSVGVYHARVAGSASFDVATAIAKARIPLASVVWDRAQLVFPISDTRSIAPSSSLLLDGNALPLLPGNPSGVSGATGVYAEIPVAHARDLSVTFDLSLNGSAGLSLLPVGNTTHASISSSALAPSFVGGYLPSASTLNENGFRGEWTISALGRSFPQVGSDLGVLSTTQIPVYEEKFAMREPTSVDGSEHRAAIFGVSLVTATDFYSSVARSTKYALLFIGLTFLSFLLIEILMRARVHPIQYLLVGTALSLFYLLLLSLSEHVGFAGAYLVATLMTVGLVGAYVRTVFRSGRFAVLIGALLALLYGYLYAVLRMDDYALLFGTILLFLVLAGVMFATRRVDWYARDKGESER